MNEVTYTYRVAEQVFTVSGEERCLIAAANMAPFRVPNDSCDQPHFAIRLQEVDAFGEIEEGFNHFFTDNSEADMPRIEVYRSNAQWLFRVAQVADAPVCCTVCADKAFRHAELFVLRGLPNHVMRFAIDNAAMLLFAFATSHNRLLEMHASVVVHEGKARLFLGHSGTGKSTHARQWLAQFHQAYLLNDDNPVLLVDSNNRAWVYGSPWSGKTACYRNVVAPVNALVRLEQYPKNVIERLQPLQAYASVIAAVSTIRWNHDVMSLLVPTIERVAMNVPCFRLQCRPDEEAVQVCKKAIYP